MFPRLPALVLLAAATAAASETGDYIHSRPLADVLGSTHVSGRYYFTGQNFLNEGADRLLELGLGAFKGWLTPGFRTAYPYNSDWPERVGSLVELVQTPHYRELLDKPFTTYSFVTGEFHRVDWKKGVSPRQAASIEGESYALAAYLLTRYKNTSKTFILQNWEGDNALRAWEIDNPKDYAVARQGMIDWLNARQDGIARARRTFGMEGVRVVGAVEMTRTPAGRRPFDHPLVVDDVVPHTRADLYALSTWGTRLPGDERLLLAQLDYIAERAPPSELYGRRNVMLGEFGAYELTYTDPRNNYPEQAAGAVEGVFNEASGLGQLTANRKQLEYALQWGVPYALYWELYCNGLRDGLKAADLKPDARGQRVATADQLKGVWLVRPDGSKAPTWHYFANLVGGGYIADPLRDWSRVHARSAHLQRPPGAPFIGNQAARPGSLLYKVDALAYAAIRILHAADNVSGAGVRLHASADGNQWTVVPARSEPGPELEGTGWRYAWLCAAPGGIPDGSRFLKVELLPGSADTVRLNKVVAEGAKVATDPHRRHYRFAELDGLLVNGQPLDGFDPAITRYRVQSGGSGQPALEALTADPRLVHRVDSGYADDGRSRVTVGFPGEATRVYDVQWVRE